MNPSVKPQSKPSPDEEVPVSHSTLRLVSSKTRGFRIKEIFEVDVRSLAIFRMAAAFLLNLDLLMRATDLVDHYTDLGILPRALHLETSANPWELSIHLASGAAWWQVFLFGVHFLVNLSLLVGYRTRASAFLSWFLLSSLHSRNPLILHSGDTLMRMLLFWGIFLPLGARWSIDSSYAARSKTNESTYFSFSSIAVLIQVALVYFVSALLKIGPFWTKDYSAAFIALHLDQLATHLGIFIRQFPGFLKLCTIGVFYLVLIGPFLLFSPIYFARTRLIFLSLFILMHLAFSLGLAIGFFPFFSICALTLFIPPTCWDGLKSKMKFLDLFYEYKLLPLYERLQATWIPKPSLAEKTSNKSEWLALGAFFLIIYWNLSRLPQLARWVKPPSEALVNIPRFDQYWDMFAPKPYDLSGWFVIDGVLESGKPVDVYNHKETSVSWERPTFVADTFKNDRWSKYLMMLVVPANHSKLLGYGQYLCRDWNIRHTRTDKLKAFEIYFMTEPITSNGKGALQKQSLWKHNCY